MAYTMKQLAPLLATTLRTLPQRLGSTSVIVVGIAGVVGVLISILAIAAGFRHTLADGGRPDRIIILRAGSDVELSSSLTREDVDNILSHPGLKQTADGKVAASPELVYVVNVPKRGSGDEGNVTLRGVGQKAFDAHPELHIVEGRMFRPAVRELIVGSSAAKLFKGLTVGSVLHLRNSDWTVTGRFESNGDVHESEMLADVDTVASSIEGGGASYSSVVALLGSPRAFQEFKDALTTDPRLKVEIQRETDYYASQASSLTQFINVFGGIVGVIMAIGALFGALNSMYTAVSTRTVEIATLRAIGFGAFPVMLSVIVEALLLALAGGCLGALVSWILFNGHSVSTLSAFSQVVFQLRVSPSLIITGIAWACSLGLIGGLIPAISAARAPIADALRAR